MMMVDKNTRSTLVMHVVVTTVVVVIVVNHLRLCLTWL